MTQKHRVALGPAQETLLIPLYGRAQFTREGSPLISDPKAIEMVDALDYDFTKFDGTPSLFGCVVRTRIYDHWVSRWLEANPAGTVVEIGAGLNTRFERLDNGTVHWIDLDLPDAIELRREFFDDTERRQMITGSVVDDSWVSRVLQSPGPWFFAAEAVLIYLSEPDVRTSFGHMVDHFPGAQVAFDTWGSWMLEHQDEHDTLGDMEARVHWICDEPITLERWTPAWQMLESCTFFDSPIEVRNLIPEPVRELFSAFADDPQPNAYRQNLFAVSDDGA